MELETEQVEGCQGHIYSDSSASGTAADPDNIKFVTSEEHLREHDGNFRNPTSYGTPVEEEE